MACSLDPLHLGLQSGSLDMLPSHRERATRPLLWFICLRVVVHTTRVPSVTWDPEDRMPSSCGLAVYWVHAKSRISAIACGSLSGQLAGGTQLL